MCVLSIIEVIHAVIGIWTVPVKKDQYYTQEKRLWNIQYIFYGLIGLLFHWGALWGSPRQRSIADVDK